MTELPAAFVAPMSHLDLTFMGSVEECLSRGAKVFSGVLDLLDRRPDFRFFLEYALFLEAYRDLQPEQAARIDDAIRQGRVELGAEWSGIFVTQEDEENLVRNVLFAKRYARERHGIDLETLQLSDIPGVIPQLPQLCAGLGIKHLVLTRCAPPDTLFWYEAPNGDRVLTWSADTYGQAGRLGFHLGAEAMRQRGLADRLLKAASGAAGEAGVPPLLYYGSDLYLPPPGLLPAVQEWNRAEPERPLAVTTPTGYFHALKAAQIDRAAPVLRGELPSTWLYAEPDHSHVSRWDSIAARALDSAERLSTLAWLRLGFAYPRAELEALWKAQLLARDHNYGGKGAGEGQPRKLDERRNVAHRSQRLLARAMGALAERVEVPRESIPVVAFNTLNWARSGVVHAHVTFYPGVDPAQRDILPRDQELVLRDPQGRAVPYQVTADRRRTLGEFDVAFIAEDVPALGYAAYTFEPAPASDTALIVAEAAEAAPRQGDQYWFGATPPDVVLENGLLRLAVDRTTGRARLYDLAGTARETAALATGGSGTAAPIPGLGGTATRAQAPRARLVVENLRLEGRHELPEVMQSPPRALSYDDAAREQTEAAVFSAGAVSVEQAGPVLATIAVRQSIMGVPAETRYTLYRALPYVDVEVRLDWDVRRFGRVELAFDAPASNPRISYGLPFGAGSVDPDALMPESGPVRGDEATRLSWERTREIARWLSVDGSTGGVAMATDHRWTRVDPLGAEPSAGGGARANLWDGAAGAAVRACLVRGGRMRPAAPHTDGDDPRARLVFHFRLQPHGGDWRAAHIPRAGWEAVQPLLSYTVNDTWSPKSLPRQQSLATVETTAPSPQTGGDALVTCVKRAEDSDSVIVRWYEATGAACDVRVAVPGTDAPERVDLLEQPVTLSRATDRGPEHVLHTQPWQIVTIVAHSGAAPSAL